MARFAYKMPRYTFLELPLAIKEAIHTLNKEVLGVPVAVTKNSMYCLVLKWLVYPINHGKLYVGFIPKVWDKKNETNFYDW